MKQALFRASFFTIMLICLGGLVFAQAPVKSDWKERFQAHDKNGDGSIDRGEFQDWMADAFFQRDTSHKGYLVFEDVKDVMRVETFKAYDKSGGGKVSLREFLNAAFVDFELMDVDKNGMLTIEEMDNYIKRSRK